MMFEMLVCGAVVGQSGPRIPQVPFAKYTLPNGLQVILHEDHSTPIVCVNLWYHVGSKDEQIGRTGFAHLFEHMMFQGSAHYDQDYFKPLQAVGARLNGSTSQDRTNYWQTVPSNALELALWMESDRMGYLLPAMSQEKLDNQRDVVKNERRQGYENRPYGLVYETILAALFPPDHPYSWPTIGYMEDLDRASREDIAAFFRRHYHPANASLCIAGDFDPGEAKRLVAKYFGSIPPGPKPARQAPPKPTLDTQRRIQMTDRVGLARLYLVWPTVPEFTDDDAALELLAGILVAPKVGRLEKRLVRQVQLAQDVSAAQNGQEWAGTFWITATARAGQSLDQVEKVLWEEIARLQQEPPSEDELQQTLHRVEARWIRSLESVGGFGGRADQLNYYNVMTGDPANVTRDFERFARVRPEDVQRVAQHYLNPTCVVLEVQPGQKITITPDPREPAAKARQNLLNHQANPPATPPADSAPSPSGTETASRGQGSSSSADEQGAHPQADEPDRRQLPSPGPSRPFSFPPFTRTRLSNGLEVVLAEHHELPLVVFQMVFWAGRSSDPIDKQGLAHLLAAIWDEGTQKRSADELAAALARLGASLSFEADWDTTGARLWTLQRHWTEALDLCAEVLREPALPEHELEREKQLALGQLRQWRNEPSMMAHLAWCAALYGHEHPYGQPALGTPQSIQAVTRTDVQTFYHQHIRPDRATLVVVGDITLEQLVPQLERVFADWTRPASAQKNQAPNHPAAKPSSARPTPESPLAGVAGSEKKASATDSQVFSRWGSPLPTPPLPDKPRLLLLDKPGAPQSVLCVGQIGALRNSPDYARLVVMNTIFGGQFTSRLNMNLRETHGFTYGARSGFDWRPRYPGPFGAISSVHREATAPALNEFLKEIEGMRGAQPVTPEELDFAKNYLTRGYPADFETPSQLAGHLEILVEFDLPDDTFTRFIPEVQAVRPEDVHRMAQQFLQTDRLTMVVVGDREQIEASLLALPVGQYLQVVQLDDNFRLVPVSAPSSSSMPPTGK